MSHNVVGSNCFQAKELDNNYAIKIALKLFIQTTVWLKYIENINNYWTIGLSEDFRSVF